MNTEFSFPLVILRKRIWMIVLLFAVTMTVILAGALTTRPVYESAVRLQIIPIESEQVALYGQANAASGGDVVELIAFQYGQLVRSSRVARQTINQLSLSLSTDELIKGLTTYQEYGFLTVVAAADSPQTAADMVTAQVENALVAYRADQSRPAVVQGEFIAGQLAEAEQAYANVEAELLRFKLSHTLDSLADEIAAYQRAVRDLRTRREDTSLAEAQLAARIAALEEEATRTTEDERSAELRRTVANLRADLAGQRGLQIELDRAIARWETELTSLIGLTDEHTRLTKAVTQARNTRDFLFNKSLEAQLKQRQGLSVGYLKVVEPARRTDRPLPSNTPRIALVGGVLSIVLGGVLAFAFEFIETLARRGARRPPAA
jgi:uncharacterized protein involved in exopolysaccharide biosynthesis